MTAANNTGLKNGHLKNSIGLFVHHKTNYRSGAEHEDLDDVGHAHSAAVSQNRTQGFDHTQKNDGYHRNQEGDDRNLGLLAERRGVDHFFFLVPTQYKGAIGNTPLELGVICKFLASLHHNKPEAREPRRVAGMTTIRTVIISTSIDVQLRTSEHRSMYSYVRLSIIRCTATYV